MLWHTMTMYFFAIANTLLKSQLSVLTSVTGLADVWILTLWERRFRIWIILDFLINLTLI